MSEGAVENAIATYAIGEKLKRLRLRKKISLVDLSKHTGLSPSMLSQLENGRLVPTLPTLTRIAMVFDLGLEHFFVEGRDRKTFSLVRAADRMRFPEKDGKAEPAYFFECLAYSAREKALQSYFAEFPPSGAWSDDHVHDGSEFIYVISGRVAVRSAGVEHVLEQGDGAFFDSSEPHAYRGAGDSQSGAIVVTTQPKS